MVPIFYGCAYLEFFDQFWSYAGLTFMCHVDKQSYHQCELIKIQIRRFIRGFLRVWRPSIDIIFKPLNIKIIIEWKGIKIKESHATWGPQSRDFASWSAPSLSLWSSDDQWKRSVSGTHKSQTVHHSFYFFIFKGQNKRHDLMTKYRGPGRTRSLNYFENWVLIVK